MTALDELSELVRTTAASAGPSVVTIGRDGRGTGFVVAAGRVLTNAHNLRDRTTSVRFADGRSLQGTVTGSDLDGDLVVVDVDTGDAPALEWSEQTAATGDIVVTVTAGRNQQRTSWGQVTSANRGFRGPRGRPIAGAIEHTAPSPAGSSGAPVLDTSGRVLAVNTHRIEHGLYLARAADEPLRAAVGAMSEGRSFERVALGVAIAPPHVAARLRQAVGLPERDGLLVRSVVDGSPTADAGVQKGDLLVKAGGRDLARADDLFEVLATVEPGSDLVIELVRGSEELTVTASFAAAAA